MKLDKTHDGTLTSEEIQEGLTNVMGNVRGNLKEFEKLMIALDRDGNGVIDYSEFLTAAVDKHKLLSKDNMRTAFKMIDKDGSGYITIDEIKEAFDIHSSNDMKIIKDIMDEVDKNHDGHITFEEFSECMHNVVGSTYKHLHKMSSKEKNVLKS